MSKAILSLGSNMGDRENYLKSAINFINNVDGIKIEKVSSIYETKPYGTPDSQENYLNCCVLLETNLNPFTLLGVCLGIESCLGRKRVYRFSPRTIDIDVIMYEGEAMNTKNLTLPHPRMHERAFVLVPMHEILPDGIFDSVNFLKYLEKCDRSGIVKLENKFTI